MNHKRGFTLIELLVVMAIIAILLGLLLPAVQRTPQNARLLLKDATQIQQIHQSWVIWSRDFYGVFPVPGLIFRMPVDAPGSPIHGEYVPGRGPEFVPLNTSANLYSACIAQNYFSPELCVGPTEPSGRIAVKDDYNYESYDPGGSPPSYWDGSFRSNLSNQSNCSYAHLPLAGKRRTMEWRESMNPLFATIGNRGPQYGQLGTVYEESITLEIHPGRKQWIGNICFNDNHVETLNTFYPEGVNYVNPNGDGVLPDNLFNNDTGTSQTSPQGYDIWLVMYWGISLSGDFGNFLEWD